MTLPLNSDQSAAVSAILAFLASEEQFFIFEGAAGTGKTYCMRAVAEQFKGRLLFTAPTNKAVRELKRAVTSDDYKPECRTIHSALGLRLSADGEIQELKEPEDPIDLTRFKAIIIDESSMNNRALCEFIEAAAISQGLKIIFMGDVCQWPPVKEDLSPVFHPRGPFAGSPSAALTKVMRHDNQILTLAMQLREKILTGGMSFTLSNDNDGEQGVFKLAASAMQKRLLEAADLGDFFHGRAKAIAWRNVTVDSLNRLIRSRIFPEAMERWTAGDRIVLTAQAKDLTGHKIASTDDEGEVEKMLIDEHPVDPRFKCYILSVTFDDNSTKTIRLLHPSSLPDYEREVEMLAMEARQDRRRWKQFWEFKELFHEAKHAYAITAHRAQGSTYDDAYVMMGDILLNRNRKEALQGLYVAVTRARKRLFIN